ncbi:PAS domain-containing protein, partial [bacterium]|nr:PAS domain-containing protein [bacterium]
MEDNDKPREQLIKEIDELRECVDRRKGQEKENELDYRQMFELSPIAIFIVQAGKIVFLNRETERLFQLSKKQLIINDYINFVYEEDRDIINEHLRKQNNCKQSIEISRYRIVIDKEIKWVGLKTVFHHFHSKPAIICFQLDVSRQQKSLENLAIYQEHLEELAELRTSELKTALAKAERANQVKDTFLANMSHEFRTPIHHISSFSKFGLKKTKSLPQDEVSEKLMTYFDNIHTSSEKLQSFINNLFDLSRLESGEVKFSFNKYSTLALIDGVESEWYQTIKEKNLKIDVIRPEEAINAEFDYEWMSKAVKGIVSNAVKFSNQDGQITISLQPVTPDLSGLSTDGFQISVSDTGIGIPEEELEMIF